MKNAFKYLLVAGSLILSVSMTSCHTRKGCPGVSSTGTSKPKLKNKNERGLFSKKQMRAMAKEGRGKRKNKYLKVD